MPKGQRPTKTALARLGRLPRRPDLVIEGGKRTVDIYIRDGDQSIKPQVVLWVDGQSGFVRSANVVNPLESADDGIGEALTALVESLTNPILAPLPGATPRPNATASKGLTPRLKPPPAGLPARIAVNDVALAEAARAIFAPLDVPVEHSRHLPAFDDAFESMASYLGADPDAAPPQPFSWDIDAAPLPALYKAAAGYARRAPWEYMPDHPPLAVTLGENRPRPDVETLYASIMGAAGEVTGIAFYYSLDDYQNAVRRGATMVEDDDVDAAIEALREAGAPVDMVPPDELREMVGGIVSQIEPDGTDSPQIYENCLVFFLEFKEDCDPTYLEWLDQRKLKYTRDYVPFFLRTAPDSTPGPPNEREVRALTEAIAGVEQFFKQYERVLQGPLLPVDGLTWPPADSATGRHVTEVRFPPPGYDWDADEELFDDEDEDEDGEVDELDQPASPAGQTTVFRFQVKLDWRKSVWRRIELRGDQTLHDLHGAIQAAFDWDDDHLYAFFLSGKAWDTTSEYESPFGQGRSAGNYRLEHLPLRTGQQFLYIFDFGDELRHLVKLEAVTPGAVQTGTQYPRITERHGESVPQYPYWDAGEDEGEE